MTEHKISWLNMPGYKPETWNPVIGCSEKSEGCKNCFAKRMAHRLMHMPYTDYYQFVLADNGAEDPEEFRNIPEWNGTTHFVEPAIYKPLEWRKPRMIFTVDMGDLFHETVPFELIDQVMAIIAIRPQHLFVILTKRPERALEYFSQSKETLIERWENAIYDKLCISDKDGDVDTVTCQMANWADAHWPLPNVWLGVTAENQEQANRRIPLLLQIPAAKRFVSIEPMLGPVELPWLRIAWQCSYCKDYFAGPHQILCPTCKRKNGFCGSHVFNPKFKVSQVGSGLDWVISGGETGSKARPMHPDWVRSLRDQCKDAGVPFFFKQWGEWMDFQEATSLDNTIIPGQRIISAKMDRFPDKTEVIQVGRKYTGNLLDGQQYHNWPGSINLPTKSIHQ